MFEEDYPSRVGSIFRSIFEGRLTALKNLVSPLYDLRLYNSKARVPQGLLFPCAAAFETADFRVPRFSEKTWVRNAETVARARIRRFARRYDCDVVVLADETVNEEETPRSYRARAEFYRSADYLNRHQKPAVERLRQRKRAR